MEPNPHPSANGLIARLRDGDPAALARALTLLEADPAARDALVRATDQPRVVPCIGFTGAPGVGKSTLISAYVAALRASGRRVAVLAVDPSSPVTGGAVLGDRVRMGAHYQDAGVFIRSMAARGHLGGLAPNIRDAIAVVSASGWDAIVIETVGTGQSEIEVSQVADIKVVIESPGLGDDVQAMKAGILEIADIMVVNKADQPGADAKRRQLEASLPLRSPTLPHDVPVVSTVATEGRGVDELVRVVDRLWEARG